MAVKIELKRSAIPGKVPTVDQLDLGELAINTYDGAIYFKQDTGVSQSIVQVTTTGGTTISASYAVTSSHAITASYALNVPDTASFSVSSSYALTASYALNVPETASFAISSSYAISGSNAETSSYAISASYAISSSNAESSSYAISASHAINADTASSADQFEIRGALTGSSANFTGNVTASNALFGGTITAQTLVVQTVTSSVIYSSGSNIFGDELSDRQQMTGSVTITGSLSVNGGSVPLGSGVAGQVAVWSGSSTVSGSNNLFWDIANSRLGIGTNVPQSGYILDAEGNLRLGVNYGLYFNNTNVGLKRDANFLDLGGFGGVRFFSSAAALASQIERMRIFPATGNVVINATTDDLTNRLQVSGSMRVFENATITGSLRVLGGITGSLFGTASWAVSASHAPTSLSASFASTASFVNPLRQNVQITGSLFISGSQNIIGSGSDVFSVDGTSGRLFEIDDTLSGSLFSVNTVSGLPIIEAFSDNTVRIGQYGTKALYVSQSAVGIGKENALNGKLDVSGSTFMTGSLNVSQGITGSLFGTASWAQNAQTASFVLNAISASYAATASSADNFLVRQDLTASNALISGTITAQTLVVQTVTSSVIYSSGSNVFGDSLSDVQQMTGSVNITGSLSVNGGSVPLGSGVAGQVAVWSGSSTVSGSNNLYWDTTNSRLGVNRSTPLVAFDIATTFNSAITPLAVIPDSATSIFLGNTGTNAGLAIGQNNAQQSWLQARSRLAGQPASTILLQPLGGNVLIGSTSDSGDRLQVISGSTLLKGAGTTGVTRALTVQNSAAANILTLNNDGEFGISKLSTQSGRIATFFGYQNPYQLELWLEVGMNQLPETTAVLGSSNVISNRGGFLQTVSGSRAISFNSAGQVVIGNGQISSSQYSALSIGGPSTNLGTINTSIDGVQLAVLPREFVYTGTAVSPQPFVTFNNFATSSLRSIIYSSAYTNAATVYIQGAPVAGSNVTFANRYALYVNTGSSYFGGGATVSGSLTALQGITGSLFGTASWSQNAVTASYALTSSYAVNFYVSQSLTASGLIYPTADGTGDMFMTTDGAGNLSFDWVKTLHQNIRNMEASSIVRGTPLFISGSTGDNADVYIADASNPLRRPSTLIAGDASLAPGAVGTGLISGEIQGVDTNAYPEGTVVYLAGGGGWTVTRPTGSALIQALGVITRQSNNGRGIIFNQIGNNLPNIAQGHLWIGDSSGYPVATPTSSIQNVVSSSYALSSSYAVSASYAVTSSFATTLASGLDITASNLLVTNAISASSITATSASFGFVQTITGSAVIIGEEYIILNTQTPASRYAGLVIYDSGSNATASVVWDSQTNHFVYQNESGASYTGGGFLAGPRNTGSLADITYPTLNKVVRGQGGDHLYDSNITDDNTQVSLSIPLVVTGSVTSTTSFVAATTSTNYITVSNNGGGTNPKQISGYWGGATPYGIQVRTNTSTDTAVGNGYGMQVTNPFSATYTTGDYSNLLASSNYNPTSGTGTYTQLRVGGTISQSGGASGITRGLYVNPTLSSAWDFRAVEWSNNASAVSGSWGLYGAGTAPNYLGGALTVNGGGSFNATLAVAGALTFFSTIRDSRANTVISQSANSVVSNRTLTIGNVTYSNIEFTLASGNYVSMPNAAIAGTTTTLVARIGGGASTGEALQVTGTAKITGNTVITGSLTVLGGITGSLFGTASWAQNAQTASFVANAISASYAATASSADNFLVRQSLTASQALISGSGTQRLTIVGSGSAQPLFTVQGSQGGLFSVTDSLSGSLFTVSDISGLPIMEVFSDNTILMGNYQDPMLLTTTRTSATVGVNVVYSLPTASYDAVYMDYTIRSGSNARAGNFMALWSGSQVNYTDNSTTDFGSTSGFVFGASISGSNMVVTGSATTAGWTIKTIVKAI